MNDQSATEHDEARQFDAELSIIFCIGRDVVSIQWLERRSYRGPSAIGAMRPKQFSSDVGVGKYVDCVSIMELTGCFG